MHVSLASTLIGAVLALASQVLARAAEPAGTRSGHAWRTPEIKAPGVSFHTFESAAAKAEVSYHLYSPAGYGRDPERRFPVVYWLHGSGGGLHGIPKVAAHFAAAIEAGQAPPCLVVFVNGLVEGMYVDWKDGSAPLETIIVKELVPHIDASYRTVASREGRLLDGYSMGGYGAARLGFQYPELFRAISIMGGGPLQADLLDAPRAGRRRATEVLQRVYGGDPEHFRSVSPRVLAEQHADAIKHGSLIRMVCGAQDETFANNRDFHEHLERLGIPHTWTVLPGVDHDPLRTLAGLGAANWGFYRQAFAEPTERESPARTPDVDISFRVRQQDRRAVIVNAPADGTKRPAVIVLHGGMMTFVYAVARPERLAAIAPVVASMFTFEAKPSVPLPILIINGAKDDEVPIEGGMSRNSIVRRGQQAPFKPLPEVVQFWVGVNRSQEEPQVETRGTVTTTVHAATPDGAATEFVVDSAGGHGWPGSKPRREGTKPSSSFSGAERVWQFFEDKRR